jgi:hypothetical protein
VSRPSQLTGLDDVVSGDTSLTTLTGPTLHAFKISSRPVFTPRETFTDTDLDILGDILVSLIARVARFENLKYTRGTGSGECEGFVKNCTHYDVSAPLDLDMALDLTMQVPPLYRPNGTYMASDKTIKYLRKLKTCIPSDKRPLWSFGDSSGDGSGTEGTPTGLWGYPILTNNVFSPTIVVHGPQFTAFAFGKSTTLTRRRCDGGSLMQTNRTLPCLVNRWWGCVASLFLILLCAGCVKHVVKATPGQDKPPVITVIGFPSGGGATFPQSTSTTQHVDVMQGTHVMVLGSAKNSGGVRQLSLKISQTNNVLWDVSALAPPSTTTVPDALYILGSDGSGNAGTEPLLFTMMADSVTAVATATNYNNQSSTISVTYDCLNCALTWGGGGRGSPTIVIDECPTGACSDPRHAEICCKGKTSGSVCLSEKQFPKGCPTPQ